MRPSSRLDAFLVPPHRDADAVAAVRSLVVDFTTRGIVEDAAAGPRADTVVHGGFAGVRVDDPGGLVLYANKQGGFHVRCGVCGTGLGREFRPPAPTRCPGCGSTLEVDALDIRPPAALGRAALVLEDIGDAEVRGVPEGWRCILARVG